jgi:hypothetical protein
MIKLHTAKESRLLLVGAWVQILHERGLHLTSRVRASVAACKMASIDGN